MGDYRTQARDTSPDADRILIERYRAMTPAEKVQIIRDLARATETLSLAGLRLRHPDANEDQIRRWLASQRLSPADLKKAFGWGDDQPTP